MHEMGKIPAHGAVKLRCRGHTGLSAAAGRSMLAAGGAVYSERTLAASHRELGSGQGTAMPSCSKNRCVSLRKRRK